MATAKSRQTTLASPFLKASFFALDFDMLYLRATFLGKFTFAWILIADTLNIICKFLKVTFYFFDNILIGIAHAALHIIKEPTDVNPHFSQ